MASADPTARYTPDHPAAFATPPVSGSRPERIAARRIDDGAPVEVHRLGGMEVGTRATLIVRLAQLHPGAAAHIVEIAPDGMIVVTHPLGAPDLAAWLDAESPAEAAAVPVGNEPPHPEPPPDEQTIAIGFTGTIGPTIQRPAGGDTGRRSGPGASHPIIPTGHTLEDALLPPSVSTADDRSAIPLQGEGGSAGRGPIMPPGAPVRGARAIPPDAETPPRGRRLPSAEEHDRAPSSHDREQSWTQTSRTPVRPHKSVLIALAVLGVVALGVVLLLVLALIA